jgi:hypothetical protein
VSLDLKPKKQRALDLRSLLGANSDKFSFSDVCKEAGIEKIKSTSTAISRLINNDDDSAISNDRLSKLEAAALELRQKHQSQLLSKTG